MKAEVKTASASSFILPPSSFRERPPLRSGFRLESKRLVIFGGKGGVGKTTAAASLALALAEGDGSARVLAFSTDPAHSLSDSFAEPVGELKRGVAGAENLDAKDPAASFEMVRKPSARRMVRIIAVVVVLPFVPDTRMTPEGSWAARREA